MLIVFNGDLSVFNFLLDWDILAAAPKSRVAPLWSRCGTPRASTDCRVSCPHLEPGKWDRIPHAEHKMERQNPSHKPLPRGHFSSNLRHCCYWWSWAESRELTGRSSSSWSQDKYEWRMPHRTKAAQRTHLPWRPRKTASKSNDKPRPTGPTVGGQWEAQQPS